MDLDRREKALLAIAGIFGAGAFAFWVQAPGLQPPWATRFVWLGAACFLMSALLFRHYVKQWGFRAGVRRLSDWWFHVSPETAEGLTFDDVEGAKGGTIFRASPTPYFTTTRNPETDLEEDVGGPGPWMEPPPEANKPWARHRRVPEGIELGIRNLPMSFLNQPACVVEDPDGRTSEAKSVATGTSSSSVTFPFSDSPALVDGAYVVLWYANGIGRALRFDVAKDTFTVRGGRIV